MAKDSFTFADRVYEALCEDNEENPSKKGEQSFRDLVFESCNEQAVVLPNCRLGPRAAVALSRLLRGHTLKKLDLTENALGDEGALTILQTVGGSVKWLSLAGNSITNSTAAELHRVLADKQCGIVHLDVGTPPGSFRKNSLDKGISVMAQALTQNRSLSSLVLRGNPLGRGGHDLISPLQLLLQRNHTLTALDLDACELGRSAASLVTALTKNQTLRHLSLGDNGAGPVLAEALAVVLQQNDALVALHVQRNGLGRAVPGLLGSLRANASLCVLTLDGNDVGDEGAQAMAEVLAVNRTLTHVSLADNGITERGGIAIATALGTNPVLSHLGLSGNPLKSATAVALAEALTTNVSLVTLELSSCKIADDGAVALVSAVSLSNENSALRKLRLRDNFISAAAGDVLVDALYRNNSITVADLRGNQLDHVRLQKVRAVCRRNLLLLRDAEPRRLRKEIMRLKGEQTKLRTAEKTLRTYTASIEATRAQISSLEAEKATFLRQQQKRRTEIQNQINKEMESIAEAEGKLQEKQAELASVEKMYADRIEELRRSLQAETELRQSIEADLARVKEELELTTKERPQKVLELKQRIEAVRAEKLRYQRQLAAIRKELARLQTAYKDGTPILPLIEAARDLLIQHQSDPSRINLDALVEDVVPREALAPGGGAETSTAEGGGSSGAALGSAAAGGSSSKDAPDARSPATPPSPQSPASPSADRRKRRTARMSGALPAV